MQSGKLFIASGSSVRYPVGLPRSTPEAFLGQRRQPKRLHAVTCPCWRPLSSSTLEFSALFTSRSFSFSSCLHMSNNLRAWDAFVGASSCTELGCSGLVKGCTRPRTAGLSYSVRCFSMPERGAVTRSLDLQSDSRDTRVHGDSGFFASRLARPESIGGSHGSSNCFSERREAKVARPGKIC